MNLEDDLELDRRIQAGEFTDEQAVAELIRIGVPSSLARRRVGILTGKRKGELPDPKTLPHGLGPVRPMGMPPEES